MTLPEAIAVGGLRYKVQRMHIPVGEAMPMGRCNMMTTTIEIMEGLAPEATRTTLLHECLEAINYSHELGLPHPTLMTLEHALDALLIANPGLVALYAQGGAMSQQKPAPIPPRQTADPDHGGLFQWY